MRSREGGGEKVMGLVNGVIGGATFAGSVLASFMKAPKSRVRVICRCLLFSMSTENFLLAFGRTPSVWCVGGFLGWIAIPLMSTNLDAIMRLRVPVDMQGRVYSVRNSLQFFTIPVGYFLGGFLVDAVFVRSGVFVLCHRFRGNRRVPVFSEGQGDLGAGVGGNK